MHRKFEIRAEGTTHEAHRPQSAGRARGIKAVVRPFSSFRPRSVLGVAVGAFLFLAMALSLSFAMGTLKPPSASGETVATETGAPEAVVSEQSLEPAPAAEGAEPAPAVEPAPSEAIAAPVVTDETAPLTEEAPATEEPAPLSEEPAPLSEETPASEEPAPLSEEAPTTNEAPLTEEAPTSKEPAPTTDEPGATNDTEVSDSSARTATADEEPATLLAAEQVTMAIAGETVDQCNDLGTVGGDTITCTVTITNNCTYNPATPSTPTCETTVVTEISCTGSAMCPTGGTQILTSPVTVITQCNNAGTGGASTITCTVTVTNNLYGFPAGAVIDSTVVQCQDPGAVDTLTCVATPDGNNRIGDGGPGGQTVEQCNSSGGQAGTMTCTVTAPPSQSTGLPVTITQCNESGTTGASTVTCTATITNNFFDSTDGGDTDGGDNDGGDNDGGDTDGGDNDGGPGDGGPGDGGPGGGGPGTGGSGTGGGGPGGPGGGGPGAPVLVGSGGPPTDGAGSPPGKSVPPGARGDTARDGGPGSSATALPYTGLDIGIAAMFGLLTLLLGVGLRLLAGSNRRSDGAGEGLLGRPPTAP